MPSMTDSAAVVQAKRFCCSAPCPNIGLPKPVTLFSGPYILAWGVIIRTYNARDQQISSLTEIQSVADAHAEQSVSGFVVLFSALNPKP